MRLVKFLSLSVAMSRNQAKFFIRRGRVSVDGEVITDPNFALADNNQVTADGNPISIATYQYLMLYKPKFYSCSARDSEYTSVLKLLGNQREASYFYFANVLGPEITGLVLLSDDAHWTNRTKRKLLKKKGIYHVRFRDTLTENLLRQIQETCLVTPSLSGVSEVDISTRDEKTLILSMTVNSMQETVGIFDALDLKVERFHLNQLGKLSLGDLLEGDYLRLNARPTEI